MVDSLETELASSLETELASSLNTHATLCGVPVHTVEMALEAAVTASLRFASTERPLFIALTLCTGALKPCHLAVLGIGAESAESVCRSDTVG